MAGLHFDITGDNSNFLRKLEESRNGVRNTSKQIEESGLSIEQMFNRLTTAAAAFGIGLGAKQLVSDITRVRGEFQQLEVAFKTMLGSKEKADALMSQLVATAAKTPFDLQGVAGGAKQLLAYGVAAEEINGTLIRLGDIAAGLSIPLGDLVYLYGTTRAQGRLYTEDLNQFTGRGIPMTQELAKHFGVAESKIKSMVSEGKVGFPEVQKAIESLTNEGGKFGGLMEAQSKTITGQISNIEDSITNLYNKIGQSSEGVINLALSGVSNLLENYEKVGEAIAVAVTAYGSYKAVLMAVTAMHAMNNKVLRQAVIEKSLAAEAGISLSNAEAAAAARTKMLMLAQNGLTKSLKAAAAATIANPYVLMAAAVTGLAYGIYKLTTHETEAEKAQRSLNEAIAESEVCVLSEQKELAKLKGELSALSKGTEEYENVKNKIIKGFGKYYDGLDEEITRIGLTEAAYNKLTEAIQKSYGARQYEKFSKDQQTELDEVMSNSFLKIQNRLYKRLGEEQGAKVFTQIKNGLLTGELSIGSGFANIEGLNKELKDVLDKVAGKDGGIIDVQIRTVETELANILKAQEIADEIDKKARVRFGIDDEYKKDNNDASATEKVEAKDKAYWEQKKKESESLLYALDISKKGSEEWKKYIKEISEAQKQIDKYSVKTDVVEKQIKSREKQNEQLLSLQRKNAQDGIALMDESREKKIAKINADFEAQRQVIEKQAKELAESNKEAETKGLNKNGLTYNQQDEIDKAHLINIQSRKKAEEELYRSEAEAMRNYLREYGTFQEQKLAIAQEYTQKIKEATTEGERLSLIKQRDSELHNVDMSAVSMNIDWGRAFGDLTGMLGSQMKNLLKELEAYVGSDKFKKSGEADKKVVYEAIERLKELVPGGEGTLNFGELQQKMKSLGDSVMRLQTAQSAQILASSNLAHAQEAYKKAVEGGNKAEIEKAKTALDIAKRNKGAADNEVNNASVEMNQIGGEFSKASKDTINGLNSVAEGLQGFASGTLRGSFEGLQKTLKGLTDLNIGGKVGDAIGNLSETLSSAGVVGQIVSAVLSIFDVLKEGIGSLVSSLIDTVLGAVTGILDDILSGDFIKKIGGSLVSGVGGLLNTVTFGGFNSLFGIGGNAKEVEAAINRLTDRNETLQTAIEDLTDEMKDSKGTKSVEAYQEAKKLQEEQNRNYLEIAKQQAGYSGSHHSWNYYMKWNDEMIRRAREATGKEDFSGTGSLWELSPEQMKKLKKDVWLWEKIQKAGKGNYGGRLTEKLDAYIDQAGKLEELTDHLYEGLTGISFGGMYDSFIDKLMDMKYSAKDAAEDISKQFMQAMLANKIGEMYSEKLKGWWEKFGKSMMDNNLTDDERDALAKEYMDYVDEAIKLRDELASVTGYDKIFDKESTQDSSRRGFDSEMTHEDAGELRGRFTALQVIGEESKNAILNMLAIAQTISLSTKENNEVLSEIRNLMVTSNGYLEDISEYTKKIVLTFGDKLNDINENIKKAL